jgi:uncharacterized iron-regulated membrane protein
MWIALCIGVYIVVLSVSGSAVVFRREFTVWLVPRTVPSVEGVRLTGDELMSALRLAYPDHSIAEVREPPRAERPGSYHQAQRQRRDQLFGPRAVEDWDQRSPTLRAEWPWICTTTCSLGRPGAYQRYSGCW